MTTTILVEGLTGDDKVPGDYHELQYGVGRRSLGALAVALVIVAAMRENTPAENTSVTKVGAGPDITVAGTPLIDGDYVLTISTGGAPGTGQFGLTRDGSSIASGVTIPTTPFTYVVPGGSGLTLTFVNGTFVLANTYSWSSSAEVQHGTANLNELYDIYDEQAARDLFAPGSEISDACLAALGVPGVTLKAMAIPWADGAVRASLTATLGGTWDQGGSVGIRLGGKTYYATVNVGDSFATVMSRLADEINDDEDCFCFAAADGADVVLTVKSAGTRGNFWSAWKVLGLAPAGLTLTLTAGATMTGGGVRFSGGTGTDDVEDTLAVLLPEAPPLYNCHAYGPNDAVNMALIEAQLDEKAGPLVQKYEQAVFGFNGTQAACLSLTQTTLNHVFSGVIFNEEGESHPTRLAAVYGAIRSVTEGANPNPFYIGRPLPGIAPRSKEAMAAEPNHAKLKAQLNGGITPTETVDGKVVITRAITTKCLKGATPDYATYDVGEATVPQRMSRETRAEWAAYRAVNPHAGPDPNAERGERAAPAGVATPSLWNAKVVAMLNRAEQALWIHEVAENQPVSIYDADAERIMSIIPLQVRPLNTQLGTNIRQLA